VSVRQESGGGCAALTTRRTLLFPREVLPSLGRISQQTRRVMCDESSALNLQYSQPSNGATTNEPQSSSQASPTPTERGSAVDVAGVDVLVVDDDAAVRRLVRATLLDDGLSVATACDGREALEAVAGYAPRVVIVDL